MGRVLDRMFNFPGTDWLIAQSGHGSRRIVVFVENQAGLVSSGSPGKAWAARNKVTFRSDKGD
jgi:hypothetical protein